MNHVEMVPVVSSNVEAIGYDEGQLILVVRYNSGVSYAYYGVPPDVHLSLMASGSKGNYLAHSVKGIYDYSIV